MVEKIKEIQRIGENQLSDLQSIVMSGICCILKCARSKILKGEPIKKRENEYYKRNY